MTRSATRWMSFSSSTSSTIGRGTSRGCGFSGALNSSRFSSSLRAQSAFGAADQNFCLYAGRALQKQAPQLGQASVRSLTRHAQKDARMASNGDWHLWQWTG